MINKTTLTLLTCLTLNSISAQTVFDWDTAPIDNGDNVTETIDGITTTFAGLPDATFTTAADFGGSSGNVVVNSTLVRTSTTSVIFDFSEAVDVTSVLALEGNSANIDYTFTPTGGSNSTVVVSLVNGVAQVDLNWDSVTSFTVSSTGSFFCFDNLTINDNSPTLSVNSFTDNEITVFPNPVKDIFYLENIKNLESVKIYSPLGKLIKETKQSKIDISHLDKGVYFLEFKTDNGQAIKRVIKE